MSKFGNFLGFMLVILIWASAMQLAYKYYEVYEPNTVDVRLEQPEFFLEQKPTTELIRQACEYYEISNIDVVIAQSILETGHFKSENCVKHNNLFGLYNSRRKQYFKFDHWSDCIKAYKEKIQYKHKPNENYYAFLKRIGYAEDPEYINKLKGIIKRYNIK